MNLVDRLDELIHKLRSEILRLHNLEKKYSLTDLGEDINLHTSSKEDILNFQLRHNIKTSNENGFISWNTEYKEEALNDPYLQVLSNNVGNIELLISKLKRQFKMFNSDKFNKILTKKLRRLNKNINNHEGCLFFDSDYRQRKNNQLKNRFDVIWNINEQFLIFPLSKRNENSFVISSREYPFIEFDMQQWCDLEFSCHLIPLFEEALGIETKSSQIKKSREAELQNIYNEYRHIFKSLEAFKFTYQTISNFKENVPSKIESLYVFLFEKLLIVNRKTKFKEYLLKAHDIKQAKIRSYTDSINYLHEERVEFHKMEWDKFIKKN